MGPAPKHKSASGCGKRLPTTTAAHKKASSGYSKSTTTKVWGPDFFAKKTERDTHTMNKSSGSIDAPGFQFDYYLKVSKKGSGGGGGASKDALKNAALKMLGIVNCADKI
ncbi:hypothetical protein HDU88_004257 [Geranomyces variabilis]|nr:hypothetical protein HDU88_004257 [Geranomyces variabilis]